MTTKQRSIVWIREWATSDCKLGGTCSFCDKHLSSIGRLKTHLLICSSTPDYVKQELKKVEQDKFKTVTNESNQPKIKKSIDRMSKGEKSELDHELARFFFLCNIPFDTVEDDNFIRFVRKLKPSYEPPSRTKLATTLLDRQESKVTG